MSQAISSPPSLVSFDQEYYWDFVTFSCKDHLFRVPKYRFISDSEEFASKYKLSLDAVSEQDFISDDPLLNAIKLDVEAHDFQNFLKALYPKVLQGKLILSKEAWLSVLKLSTKWSFKGFRSMAIANLTPLILDPIERVQLGNKFNVSSWLKTGYQQLVTRGAVITPDEVQVIHYERAIKIYMIRDAWNKSANRDVTVLAQKIHDAFATHFKRVNEVEVMHLTAQEKKDLEEARCKETEAVKKAQEQQCPPGPSITSPAKPVNQIFGGLWLSDTPKAALPKLAVTTSNIMAQGPASRPIPPSGALFGASTSSPSPFGACPAPAKPAVIFTFQTSSSSPLASQTKTPMAPSSTFGSPPDAKDKGPSLSFFR